MSVVRFGSAVGERDVLHEGGVAIEHRRRDVDVVGLHRGLECFEVLVAGVLGHEDLGGSRPDHDQAIAAVRRLEVADVLADELGQLELGRGALDVRAVQALHVVLVEDGGHRLDRLEEVLDRLNVLVLVEDACVEGGGVGVVGDGVPCPEDEVFEVGERDEVLDQGRSVVGALAKADRTHLGDRADGLAEAAASVFDAGDEGGGNGAKADDEDAELAAGGLDFHDRCGGEILGFQDDTSFACEGEQTPMVLRGNHAGGRPVLNGALAGVEELGERALAAEAGDDAFSAIFGFHGCMITIFSLITSQEPAP